MSSTVAHARISSNDFQQDASINESLVAKPRHTDFRILPLIADRLKLSRCEKILYGVIRGIAGDNGVCFMANKTLAEWAEMSERSVRYAKKELARPRAELEGRSLITIQSRIGEDKSRQSDLVYVVDIWDLNAKYSRSKKIIPIDDFQKFTPSAKSAEAPATIADKQDLLIKTEELSVIEAPVGPPIISDPPETGILEEHSYRDWMGRVHTVKFNDLFLLLMNEKFEFKTLELKEAWKRLRQYQNPISNLSQFMIGVINNLRKKQKHTDIINSTKNEDTSCNTPADTKTKTQAPQRALIWMAHPNGKPTERLSFAELQELINLQRNSTSAT